ncbi:MAG: hypothetical protein JEZ04_14855 [Spirochaetales bacterium]|nr:hypothetical protein [Spirochaetales bacterium]
MNATSFRGRDCSGSAPAARRSGVSRIGRKEEALQRKARPAMPGPPENFQTGIFE